MKNRLFLVSRAAVVAAFLAVCSVPSFADIDETWHQKYYYLEAVAGYNVSTGDIPMGLMFTYQQYRVGPYASVMYGFRNTIPYSDAYNPTKYGWYASLGASIRVVGDWSPIDAQVYVGPSWRVVTTARDLTNWKKLTDEQQKEVNPQLIGRWGFEFGARIGGGRAGGRFAVWSGSVGVKMFYIGEHHFEFVPQVGLSAAIGVPAAAVGSMCLFWL